VSVLLKRDGALKGRRYKGNGTAKMAALHREIRTVTIDCATGREKVPALETRERGTRYKGKMAPQRAAATQATEPPRWRRYMKTQSRRFAGPRPWRYRGGKVHQRGKGILRENG
jgi:hypothetical protein